ncbi:MAG: hypothetical protein HYY06_02180 [Deltaproteobacteria bacterium]|nr:hypothetical protein [Deltaproteobacteria bacterium]
MTATGRPGLAIALALLCGVACSEESPPADGDADSDADSDADADSDGDADGGCGAPAEPDTTPVDCALVGDPCLPGELEMGSGHFSFERITPGDDTVELIHGPQGGYHVFGGLLVRGLSLEPGVNVLFRFHSVDDCEDRLYPGAERVAIPASAFANEGDGYKAAFGYLVILNTTKPLSIDGNRWVLGAELTDAAGDTYQDDVEVLVRYAGD